MAQERPTRVRGDESEKMAAMNRWLDAVCAELDVDRAVLDANSAALLALISDVAHGPSRPGAPVTAFLVGLAAARAGGDVPAAAGERIARVRRLVAAWETPAEAAPGGAADA
ncbi:DUF6457 domain-containing protein [Georgenia thermotolerans]|uniref:Molybdopterin-guanine dinucleotide biosynthesis protein n=1 Tax=Georgenia thermotolerans TaxID=527326 RepID=A0A7J5UJN6_9MICO|nr:DUF6457 domain-containing protein [Georgenia thermotolerans]KAE8762615.1 molybdopterin-guanine dinucleotide biosynthesis protein [Georgenia thermotolerans]